MKTIDGLLKSVVWLHRTGMGKQVKIEFLSLEELTLHKVVTTVLFLRHVSGKWIFFQTPASKLWTLPKRKTCGEECLEETKKKVLQDTFVSTNVPFEEVAGYQINDEIGLILFADNIKLSDLPCRENHFVDCFSVLPENLKDHEMVCSLFQHLQNWLNIQTSANELWDLYDENRCRTGKLHRRGNPLRRGDYHLGIEVWVQRDDGKFLLTKRAPNKGYPNLWEPSGGSALAGDDSLNAALREVREETGLFLKPENGRCIFSFIAHEDTFCDIWFFRQEFDLKDLVLQPGETCDSMAATWEEIFMMQQKGKLVPLSYLDKLYEQIGS